MAQNTIVTINRQFCSGGRIIGEKVAERLGYTFFDKKLVMQDAEKEGYKKDSFDKMYDIASNSFLYSLVMSSYSSQQIQLDKGGVLTSDSLFKIQSDIIRRIAEQQSCVIVGRCADYILREHENLVKIFIRADLDYRIDVYNKTRELPENNTIEYVLHKMDKKRSSYYKYYTGNAWMNFGNYDLIINMAKTDVDTAVDIIVSYVNTYNRG